MLYKNLCNKSSIIEGNNFSSDKYSPGPEVIKLFPANNKLCLCAGLSAALCGISSGSALFDKSTHLGVSGFQMIKFAYIYLLQLGPKFCPET